MILTNKRKLNKISGYTLAALIAAGMMFQTSTQSLYAAEDCQAACTQYVGCTDDITGSKPTAAQERQLMQGCMNSCKNRKLHKGIMNCYKQSKDQCKVYFQCVVNEGKKLNR